jgi:hypothetical protein
VVQNSAANWACAKVKADGSNQYDQDSGADRRILHNDANDAWHRASLAKLLYGFKKMKDGWFRDVLQQEVLHEVEGRNRSAERIARVKPHLEARQAL